MARGRLIAKSLSTSQRYAALHELAGPLAEFCQLLYPLLITHSDDFGRLPGDIFTVKHVVVPTSPRSDADLTQALAALDASGLIYWYAADGRKWIQIQQFDEHQSGLHKRSNSHIPPPPPGNPPEIPGNSRSRARAELKGTEEKRSTSTRLAPPTHTAHNGRRKPKPDVPKLAAMILREAILQIPRVADQAEAAKCAAAKFQLPYDSRSIANALASAQAQAAKRSEVMS